MDRQSFSHTVSNPFTASGTLNQCCKSPDRMLYCSFQSPNPWCQDSGIAPTYRSSDTTTWAAIPFPRTACTLSSGPKTLCVNVPSHNRDPGVNNRTYCHSQVLRDNDLGGYTVPAHGLYPFQWNWDSAIVASGWAVFDETRAWQEIESLFSGQWDDGMVPSIVFHKPSTTYFPGPEVWGTKEKPSKSTGESSRSL